LANENQRLLFVAEKESQKTEERMSLLRNEIEHLQSSDSEKVRQLEEKAALMRYYFNTCLD
jgi:hypothetical protein